MTVNEAIEILTEFRNRGHGDAQLTYLARAAPDVIYGNDQYNDLNCASIINYHEPYVVII